MIPSTVSLVTRTPPAAAQQTLQWAQGKLLVWETPHDTAIYVLGIDPAQGTGNDNAVIQVLRVGDRQRPDEQVAEYASALLDPYALAEVAARIGRLYRGREDEALAIVETNSAGGGTTTLEDLRVRWDYSHLFIRRKYDRQTEQLVTKFGFATNEATRQDLVARALNGLRDRHFVLNSPFLIEEMVAFESSHSLAKAKAAHGQKDDRVLAWLLAFYGAHADEWAAGEDLGRLRNLTVSRGPADAETMREAPPTPPSPQQTVRRDGDLDADMVSGVADWLEFESFT